ncbi:hypothetical protein [Actinacidiphila sp. ITFR-21]|uniref:hypothetical protein n=1 Tax=Actinacidiphila sp. ITFR-21 TaxID=3075199 RepID=UPI00288AFBCA|nr:hypothetical protein [Streptomyces sp. ITFR-21]WNI18996.1 hypothetical protein RLT57_27990 [Streptomyces sp. ITFR-21]
MPSKRVVLYAVSCLATGALLSGCGASGGPAGASGQVTTPAAMTTAAVPPTGRVPDPTGTATTARPTRPPRHEGAPMSRAPRPTAPPAAFEAGNPRGNAPVPAAARAVDTSHPTRTIGDGTPAGCTSAAVVAAVAAGGVITFSCGPAPVVITMKATAKVRNASARVVLDGGGKVTLSGAGQRRILYMDTCDQAQGWTTSHCQDQSAPELTVQNLTFADGDSTGDTAEGGGGGAVLVRGGRFKVADSRFVRNRCDGTGPDLGGAAIRVLDQYQDLPVYVTGSTFGGAPGQGGSCSNGGALSSIGVSWVVLNSVLTYNSAVGHGANPARGGTPGGGSGGAVYTDGNQYTVRVEGSLIAHNDAKEGGGAFFYVSNDRTGTLAVHSSTLRANPSHGFETAGFPGVFFIGAGKPDVSGAALS